MAIEAYLSVEESIGSMLAQNNELGKEQAVYYLSRVLTDVECRYSSIEKFCLSLYYSAMKLRVYMWPVYVYILCQTNMIKYMLSRPLITGRIVKGKVLADFLADHPSTDLNPQVYDELESLAVFLTPWTLMFDGSSKVDGAGAEYEALIIGLKILIEMAVGDVKILGDSNLVLSQITEDFKCLSWQSRPFHSLVTSLINQFDNVQLKFWLRIQNEEANNMAQAASGIRVPAGVKDQLIKITRRSLPSAEIRNTEMVDSWVIDIEDLTDDDWRIPFIMFL
ncbi:uncharacterized protein LOC132268987 [Cornus florida]|uniref:uncharacterized protein LOC132268987 n=1 Tax=Cornus florida TaxID=4283 RepID=UPI00289C1FB5|nr:uncharacterized protein LOC132268987 [Cornus florida]